MIRRLFLILAVGGLLAGCVTSQNTLSPDQISSFHLQGVNVTFTPNAQIHWEGPEGTDGQRSHVEAAIASKIRNSMISEVGSQLSGSRPVRLDIRVHGFSISPAIQRIIIGGKHTLRADVDLVDAKSGSPLLSFPAFEAILDGNSGPLGVALGALIMPEPTDVIIRYYVLQYRNWLLRK